MKRIAAGLLVICSATSLRAQSPVRVSGFGFGAAAVVQRGAEPAAQLAASALLTAANIPLQASLGTSIAELRASQGAQRDLYADVLATHTLTRYVIIGAGPGVHSLSTRIAGAETDAALRAAENAQSGWRAALVAFGAVQVPLAARDVATLQLGARSTLMRGLRKFSFGVNVALRPAHGRLRLGENARPLLAPSDLARGWDALVRQVMLFQGELAPVTDVVATRNSLLVKFQAADPQQLRDAVARIARVLNGSNEALTVSVSGPQPVLLAVAATAGGFPAERITLVTDTQHVTLQATRPPDALSLESARSSRRR